MQHDPLKIGNLIILSAFGRAVVKPNTAKIGIVVSGPYENNYMCAKTGLYVKYLTYDVILGQELLKDIPEDFVYRMGDDEHEENPTNLEELPKGSLTEEQS